MEKTYILYKLTEAGRVGKIKPVSLICIVANVCGLWSSTMPKKIGSNKKGNEAGQRKDENDLV